MIAALILVALRPSPQQEAAEAAVPEAATPTATVPPPPSEPLTGSTTTTATEAESTTTSLPVTTTTTKPPNPAPDLAALRIDDQQGSTAGYSRDLFPTWLDFDGNGCDARDDTLTAESLTPVGRNGCDVTAGEWVSIYDGVTTTDPSTLDVDHMVPLAEAWRSGAHAWDAERRARFANHMDDPDHLIAVTASSNRSKSDSPPNVWRPPASNSWCRYATAWVQVKITWDLSGTTAERDALGQMLATC